MAAARRHSCGATDRQENNRRTGLGLKARSIDASCILAEPTGIDELSRVPNWLASERPFALPYDAGAVYVASI